MKRNRIIQSIFGLLALASTAAAQTTTTTTTTTGFAPFNFGNVVLTSTPSNATGPSGVSTVFTSSGTEYTFGTGGALVNPAQFNYMVTGPNTATVTVPARGNTPASTMNLVFTSPTRGTYTTVSGTDTTTGSFNLATIPSEAPIVNVSSRAHVPAGGSSTLGFVVGGTMPRRVLVRAVGPGLSSFGVAGALSNPTLSMYRGNQLIAMNDDWGTMATLSTATGTGGTTTGGTTTGSTTGGTTTGGTTTGAGTTGGTTTGGTTAGGGTTGGTATDGATTGGTTTGGTAAAGTATATGTTSGGVFTGTLLEGSSFTTQLATVSNFQGTGAFALQSGSRDASFVATLPPGPYTVVVSSSTASGGTTTGGTTEGGTTTGGTTTGGTTTGGTTTGGTTTGGATTDGTATTAANTTGEALVEVYFIE